MKKTSNLFLKSTFILIISGFLTKFFGFIIRVVYTRIIGIDGINLYSIATPTYSLLLTIATLAIPTSISKLIAEATQNKKRSLKILTSSALIIIVINILIIIIMFLTSDFIACSLLKEPRSEYILKAMALTLPFVSISSVFKGYFYGKQNMIPHATSNIIEQIFRLIIILIVLPILIKISVIYAVIGLVLLTIISEIVSIIIFLFFLPKHIYYDRSLIIPNKSTTKSILDISLPTVSSRIIGNIGYFFEPIILTNFLIFSGYTSNYVLMEYGAYNAYALTLLTMPSFFIAAISMSLLPEISKYYSSNNKKMVKKRINQGLFFAIIIGILFTFFIFLFRDKLLFFLYKTTNGSDYIKILAPFFFLFYLEGVMISSLQALNKAKLTMKISFFGVIIKLISLMILSLCHIGLYSLVFSEIINIIFVVGVNYYYLKKEIKDT
ncbi:MAG: oligosaccharide flippase family protein [Bacilli bacterium]